MSFLQFSFFLLTMGTDQAIHSGHSESSQVPVRHPILHSRPWLHAMGMLRECLPCSQWVTLYLSPHGDDENFECGSLGYFVTYRTAVVQIFVVNKLKPWLWKGMKLRIELSRRMQSSLSAWGRLPSLLECLCINHRMRLCKLSEIYGIGLCICGFCIWRPY